MGNRNSRCEDEIEPRLHDADFVPLGGVREIIGVVRGGKPDVMWEQDLT